jgi:hypothetical protein
MTIMTFDIDAYRSCVAPVRTDDLDLTSFHSRPLTPEVLRCLRYMHDVESHTICYLRDLLMTASHRDPRITTFLTMWAYEEYWHGVALGRVLAAHGEAAENERITPMRAALGRRDRFAPLANAAASGVLGDDFVAVHMSWGAINEWSTQAGYQALSAKAAHPALTELLARIARQESRHIAFYASEARARLAASGRARVVTRWALRHLWAPVGSGVMPDSETRFVHGYLLGGSEGRELARRLDRNIDRLPGLSGLHLLLGAASADAAPQRRRRRRPLVTGAAQLRRAG